MIRKYVGLYAFEVDSWCHKHQRYIPKTLLHNICLGADVTVGWGPGCNDWEVNKTRFLVWFDKWFWNGHCTHCFGKGYHEEVTHYDPPGQNAETFYNVTCNVCKGTGKRAGG